MGTTLTGGIAALVIAMGVGRFAFTPILPVMQAGAGLTPEAAGLLASLNYLGYFLGALTAGLVPHGPRRTAVFRAALVVSVVTTAAMGLAGAPAAWGALRLISGLASAVLFILGSAVVLDALARGGRDRLAGWLFTGVGLGIAGSGLFVALATGPLGWRGDWLGLGAICAVLALPAWTGVRDRTGPEEEPKAASAPAPRPLAAGGAPLALLTLAYFLEGAGYIVTGTFLVAILKTDPATAAVGEVAWMAAGLAAMPSGVLWAWVGRRIGPWRGLMAAHLVQAAGIVLPLAGGGAVVGLVAAVLYGATFIGIVTLALGLARTLSGGGAGATRAIGMLTAAYGLGQILGPLPAGMVAAHTGRYDLALAGAAAVVILGVVALVAGARLAGRRHPG
jgi:predicted MFS family arabinose efflux permease